MCPNNLCKNWFWSLFLHGNSAIFPCRRAFYSITNHTVHESSTLPLRKTHPLTASRLQANLGISSTTILGGQSIRTNIQKTPLIGPINGNWVDHYSEYQTPHHYHGILQLCLDFTLCRKIQMPRPTKKSFQRFRPKRWTVVEREERAARRRNAGKTDKPTINGPITSVPSHPNERGFD